MEKYIFYKNENGKCLYKGAVAGNIKELDYLEQFENGENIKPQKTGVSYGDFFVLSENPF